MTLDRLLDTGELARLAGVSARTLRHYDAIGLVRPAEVRDDGRRLYGRAELLRLQRVLILRALGLRLEHIARILDEDVDEVDALRAHRTWLVAQHDELGSLIGTVDRTIAHLQGGTEMDPQDVFHGIPGYDAAMQREYEVEATERWGADVVADSQRRTSSLSPEEAAIAMAEHERVAQSIAQAMTERVSPDSGAVQELVARHYAWVCTFWTPDAQAYRGLGRLYVDDPRFRANYDRFGEGTAVYLCEAIEVYASTSL